MNIASHIKNLKGPIVVTGASGFIGANLFKTLLAIRSDVFAVVKDHKGWRLDEVNDTHIVALDFNESVATKNFIASIKPKTVFDCISYGAYSFEEDSALIYKTNFHSLVNFVKELSPQPIQAYIHAGSSSEYGINSAGPLETSACMPNSHYAVSKLSASNFLKHMGKNCQFPVINLRLYSVYGPLEDSSRLIPNIIRNGLCKKFPPLVNPLISRDFVYIDDVCNAFILAASKIHPDLYGEDFNIGSGEKITIQELSLLTKKIFKIKNKPIFGAMKNRSWDLADWYSNSNKANKLLSWKSEVSLEEGLLKMADWIKKINDSDFIAMTKTHNKAKKKSLSAIIACYKDAQAIPIMYKRLTSIFEKLKIDYEIIFVNDDSPDNSADVIKKLSENDHRIIGITHSRNFGSQMAFRSGMELSSKEGVVLLDGDLQDPPELISAFYKKWNEGFDVVYGRRVKREMAFYRDLIYKIFYRIFSSLSYVRIPHDAGDFSLIDYKAKEWMLKCEEGDLFMRGIRAYVGFKQTGVDYIRPERLFGKSTNSFLKNIEWAKKGIFSFSNLPLSILTATGLALFLFSMGLGLIQVLLKIYNPAIAPPGITLIMLTTLFFGSINLLAIGILGEYMAKILTEVKNRPKLIRSSIIRDGKIVVCGPTKKT